MLLWRMKEFLEGGGELLRAEAELASKRFRRVLVGSALVLLAGIVALAGIFTILAGVAVLVAQHLGWSAALIIVGSGVTGLCMVGWLIAYLASDGPGSIEEPLFPETQSAKQQASRAKEKMADAATPGSGSSGASGSSTTGSFPTSIEELKDSAVAFTVRNPVLVASGAMLAFSVIGPGKTLRMVSRAAATAGLVGTLIDSLSGQHSDSDHGDTATASSIPTATPTASPDKSTPGRDPAKAPRPSAAGTVASAQSPTEALRDRVSAPRGKGVSERAAAL